MNTYKKVEEKIPIGWVENNGKEHISLTLNFPGGERKELGLSMGELKELVKNLSDFIKEVEN